MCQLFSRRTGTSAPSGSTEAQRSAGCSSSLSKVAGMNHTRGGACNQRLAYFKRTREHGHWPQRPVLRVDLCVILNLLHHPGVWSQHLKQAAYALDLRDVEANSSLVCCQQGTNRSTVRTGYAGICSLSDACTQKPSACPALFLRARLRSARRRSPLPVDKAGLLRTASVQACAQAGRSAASQRELCMFCCCRAASPLPTTANNRRASHMILIRIESLAWPAERTAVVYSHKAQHSRLAQLGTSSAAELLHACTSAAGRQILPSARAGHHHHSTKCVPGAFCLIPL